MTDNNSFAARFGPQRKKWLRTLDALLVMMAAVAIAMVLFLLPQQTEAPLLRGTAYAALASTPIVAYTLYKESNLSRLERLAILVLVLCVGMTLMVATVELNRIS